MTPDEGLKIMKFFKSLGDLDPQKLFNLLKLIHKYENLEKFSEGWQMILEHGAKKGYCGNRVKNAIRYLIVSFHGSLNWVNTYKYFCNQLGRRDYLFFVSVVGRVFPGFNIKSKRHFDQIMSKNDEFYITVMKVLQKSFLDLILNPKNFKELSFTVL